MCRVLLLICVSACGAVKLFDDALYRDALDPELCIRQLKTMSRIEFSDASFRAPPGLLVGNLASLGNYHQCLAINQGFPDINIRGKYCLIEASMTPPSVRIPSLAGVSVSENVTWTEVTLSEDQVHKYAGKSLSLAVCVPKSCSVAAVLARYTEHPVVRFNYTEQYCRLPDDKPFVAADYVATIIFSLLGMLTVVSTAYELCHIFLLNRDPDRASKLLRVCSLYTNTRRLLTFEKPRPLDCVDGIRSLSMLWIVIHHMFYIHFHYSKYVVNSFEMIDWINKTRAVWYKRAVIAVDSFFTLSGLFLVYTSINKKKKASLLRNLPMFYLNRYLRLFPLLATAVLLQASVMHRVSDGPNWHCCLIPAWYLSVDMQLYVLSPLVLYWLLDSRRTAYIALALAVFASLAAAFASCYIGLSSGTSSWVIYCSTLTRSPPFFIGMLFGYILQNFRGQNIELPQWFVFACHTLALSIFIIVIYTSSDADEYGYYLVTIPCWSLALCWLVFACAHGYGGPVNWLLSLRLWKFPSRISYAMYLFHMPVQKSSHGAIAAPVYFNMETIFSSFASNLLYTVMLSTAASVLVEEPALTLQRMLPRDDKDIAKSQLGPGTSKPQRKQNEDGKPDPSMSDQA